MKKDKKQQEKTKKVRKYDKGQIFVKVMAGILAILMVVAFLFTRIGFVELINIFYPLYGYLGIIVGLGFFVLWIRKKVHRSKYYDRTNIED